MSPVSAAAGRLYVDAWDPAYGTGFGAEDGRGPSAESTAQTIVDLEVMADSWRPLDPPADRRTPHTVLLVDGVRRIDARVWSEEPDGPTHPGIAASYAAGVVRCDLRYGNAEVVRWGVQRGLFTPSPAAVDITAGTCTYAVHRTESGEPAKLVGAVQARLRQLEIEVSAAARADGDNEDDLLVVDGPLQSRGGLPRSLGYIKTHQKLYLPSELTSVVTSLRAGQRTPVFALGTTWRQHSWYLRLPAPAGSPWTGIVRVECSADLSVNQTIALADLSAITLPRLASRPYKDPRAPQNLVPIAGLEKRLRGLLGDARFLHRTLLGAAARTVA